MANQPFEIIVAPFDVYVAPAGEAAPDLADAPAGNWALLGTNGKRNYSEDGVTVRHNQSLTEIRVAGTTGPVKAVRTEEGLVISLTLFDLTPAQYAKALNDATVSNTGAGVGTAGKNEFNLLQGTAVNELALLVRGDVSPEGDNFKSQYWIPRAVQSGSPEPVFQKGEPAGLALEFMAIEDANDGFGTFEAQDAAAQ